MDKIRHRAHRRSTHKGTPPTREEIAFANRRSADYLGSADIEQLNREVTASDTKIERIKRGLLWDIVYVRVPAYAPSRTRHMSVVPRITVKTYRVRRGHGLQRGKVTIDRWSTMSWLSGQKTDLVQDNRI